MPSTGATFPRLHVWSNNETILPVDLNAEFNNILNNFSFEGLDDYELNVTQMRLQTTPGGLGTESLATSGAGEIERIRFVLARLLGTTYWYEGSPVSLTQVNTLLNLTTAIPPNRLDSSATALLIASPTLASVTLNGSPTPFIYHINGNPFTIAVDVTLSGLTLGSAAASSSALVNDVTLTGQLSSKTQGENGTVITIDGVGADITGRTGKVSAFRVTQTPGTGAIEYFLATVGPTGLTLGDARRGYFFDSSGNPIPRIALFDNDLIQLMSLAYIFVTSLGTLRVTYNAPAYSSVQPAIAAEGDHWFNLTAQTWMIFSGGVWVVANDTFLGLAIQDSVKTVGTRSAELFAGYSSLSTIVLTRPDSTHITGASIGEEISVGGNFFAWPTTVPSWASTGQFAPGVVLSANTTYYVYVTNEGALLLDTIPPYNRIGDLGGFYHPYNLWRAVGFFTTDGASLFGTPTTYNAAGVGQGASNLITGSQIAPATITGSNIATGTVTSANILDLTIVAADIANATITEAKITPATITGASLTNNINLPGFTANVATKNITTSNYAAGTPLGIIRGRVSAAGVILAGEGFTVTYIGAGTYNINYNNAFADIASAVITIFGAGDRIGYITAQSTVLVQFQINTFPGVILDNEFNFIVIGPRTA